MQHYNGKEDNCVKLYRFYFKNMVEPILIEACNRKQAKQFLAGFLANKNYVLESETVTHPITGRTKKLVNNITYVWFVDKFIAETLYLERMAQKR